MTRITSMKLARAIFKKKIVKGKEVYTNRIVGYKPPYKRQPVEDYYGKIHLCSVGQIVNFPRKAGLFRK